MEVLPTDATTCKCFCYFGGLSIYIFRQESAVLSILEHFCQIYEVLPEGISFSKPAKFLLTSVMLILLGSAFSLANCHRRSCNCVASFLWRQINNSMTLKKKTLQNETLKSSSVEPSLCRSPLSNFVDVMPHLTADHLIVTHWTISFGIKFRRKSTKDATVGRLRVPTSWKEEYSRFGMNAQTI